MLTTWHATCKVESMEIVNKIVWMESLILCQEFINRSMQRRLVKAHSVEAPGDPRNFRFTIISNRVL